MAGAGLHEGALEGQKGSTCSGPSAPDGCWAGADLQQTGVRFTIFLLDCLLAAGELRPLILSSAAQLPALASPQSPSPQSNAVPTCMQHMMTSGSDDSYLWQNRLQRCAFCLQDASHIPWLPHALTTHSVTCSQSNIPMHYVPIELNAAGMVMRCMCYSM